MVHSTELAAGTGFTFETKVVAYYLGQLLVEGQCLGHDQHVVRRVAVQQVTFGDPLDDLILELGDEGNPLARLSLQVKSSLTISDAPSNTDFREVVRACWATLQDNNFRKDVDRYGVAVGSVARTKMRELTSLCEMARESQQEEHFFKRFTAGGQASQGVLAMKHIIQRLLDETIGRSCEGDEIYLFLRHFVLIEFQFLHEGASDRAHAITVLRTHLPEAQRNHAPYIWSRLLEIAANSAGRAGQFTRRRVHRDVSSAVKLPKIGRRLGWMTMTAAAVCVIGLACFVGWKLTYIAQPIPTTSTISAKAFDLGSQRHGEFLDLLSVRQDTPMDSIRVGCLASNEDACKAAGKFIVLLSEAGWNVVGNQVYPMAAAIPTEGVTIASRSDDIAGLASPPPHLGRWSSVSTDQLLITMAFRYMDVPLHASTDPGLPDGTIGVYFGYNAEVDQGVSAKKKLLLRPILSYVKWSVAVENQCLHGGRFACEASVTSWEDTVGHYLDRSPFDPRKIRMWNEQKSAAEAFDVSAIQKQRTILFELFFETFGPKATNTANRQTTT